MPFKQLFFGWPHIKWSNSHEICRNDLIDLSLYWKYCGYITPVPQNIDPLKCSKNTRKNLDGNARKWILSSYTIAIQSFFRQKNHFHYFYFYSFYGLFIIKFWQFSNDQIPWKLSHREYFSSVLHCKHLFLSRQSMLF